jgi:hypothetical protein
MSLTVGPVRQIVVPAVVVGLTGASVSVGLFAASRNILQRVPKRLFFSLAIGSAAQTVLVLAGLTSAFFPSIKDSVQSIVLEPGYRIYRSIFTIGFDDVYSFFLIMLLNVFVYGAVCFAVTTYLNRGQKLKQI